MKNILSNSDVASVTRHHARFGNVLEYRIPGGQGARFSADGKKFIGFKEAMNDIAEIHKMGDTIRKGEYFYTSSGRVYKIHNNSVHPVSGPGTINISSVEYKVLVTAKKEGFGKAIKQLNILLDNKVINQTQFENTKKLLDLMKKGN